MRSRIEMQRVHYVVVFQRVGKRLVDVLAPGWRSDYYYSVLVVFAYYRDNLFSVRFYNAFPGRVSVRLVNYLVDNVGVVCVFL